MPIRRITSKSLVYTEKLASKIGRNLKGGEVIELISDLGGGKTTFVRGLVHGTGSNSHVASPTFTISREYSADKFTIKHFDFYRLDEPGLIEYELAENLKETNNVIVVEWSDVVKHVLPVQRLTITIKAIDENTRQFIFSYPKKLEYMMKGIK